MQFQHNFQVAYDHYYNPSSTSDKCTLFNERQLINRRNVVGEVKSKYNACKQFFDVALDARIVAAAMQILKIADIEETAEGVPAIGTSTKTERQKYLKNLSEEVSLLLNVQINVKVHYLVKFISDFCLNVPNLPF